MLNSPMLSIFQHFHAIPLRSPLISLRSKWRLTGFLRRFTPKNPVRLYKPFGQLPRWGAKNVLPLNLIVFPRGEGCDTRIPSSKQTAYHPCESIRSPNTVIPSAAEGSLLHCRHMHTCALTQMTPWCFLFRLSLTHDLPLCKKDPSTSALMTRKKDGSSHIVFHTAA